MGTNRHMKAARKNPNSDEFYTSAHDVWWEMPYYHHHFKNASIYCNCDDLNSAFVNYFIRNGNSLQLRQLIAPFSEFRRYLRQLIEFDVKFLIIAPLNAITYPEVFPYIKSGKVCSGVNNSAMIFTTGHGRNTLDVM